MKEGANKIFKSKSKAFLAFCFCFILGVSIFSSLDLEKYWLFRLYILMFAVGFAIILSWPQTSATPSAATPPRPLLERGGYVRFGLLCVLFFILGGARFMLSIPTITENHVAYYNGSEIEFIGRVVQEPDIGIAGAKYVVSVIARSETTKQSQGTPGNEGIASSSASWRTPRNDIKGRVLVNAPLYPQYNFGEMLKIKCKLQAPKNAEDSTFNYEKYLAKDGIFSVCFRPAIVICHPRENGDLPQKVADSRFRGNDNEDCVRDDSWVRRPLKYVFSLKSAINTQVEKLWPEPQSALMAGLLYGARAGLPQELKDNFSRVGITHIIAISGYNISIIASLLMTTLIAIGLYRRQAFWACVSGIILFVIFTGASASVMRAGIMGVIVLIAQQLGRLSRMGNVLAITAALMLLMNPYILIWDAGFQLSFLATIGLVYLSPVIDGVIARSSAWAERRSNPNGSSIAMGLLRFARNDKLAPIREVFVSTLSAITITLPLILYQFGRLSIVAPLVNVLVLWIIPWLMLFGFIAVMLSFIIYPAGQVVAWLAGIGLKYVIIVAQWFGGLAWASVEMRVGLLMMVVLYAALIAVIVKFSRKSDF